MPSKKRRTTSKSGGSATSTKKETSRQTRSTSATARASSGNQVDLVEDLTGAKALSIDKLREITRVQALLRRARERQQWWASLPLPKLKQPRKEALARLAAGRRRIQDLEEYLGTLNAD